LRLKKLRKVISVILSVVMAVTSLLTLCAYASTANLRYFERGVLTDGQNTAYYLIDKDNRTLYLTGDGVTNARTPDYPDAASGPFAGRTDVTCIVVEEDVARVGDYVFANMKSVDTLEIQSNLLSSSSSMSSKAMSGDTALRHIRGESSFLSTDILLQVVKGALNIASGNWIQLALNGFNIVKEGVSEDSLSNEVVHAMVSDYIMTGDEVFLGDLDQTVALVQARELETCYWENAYHHQYVSHIAQAESCTTDGERMYVCSVCGSFYSERFGNPLGHSYVYETLYEASCLKEGISKGVCTRCGDVKFVSIPATGHTEGVWSMVKVPTDTEKGTLECRCVDCGEFLRQAQVGTSNSTYYKYKVGLNASDNTVSSVVSSLTQANYLISVVKDGVVLSDSEKVGTGYKIIYSHIPSSKVTEIDTVVLYGDVDGDGLVGEDDFDIMNEYVGGKTSVIENGSVYKRAADLNNDGVIDAFDLSLLDLQISETKALDQSKPQY